ncbi:MAG: diacylglycerol kinase [Erysipelotrichaceae bacterium]|nr:diacylglycerol kinase [Erysipelotrichaceae bacterium]
MIEQLKKKFSYAYQGVVHGIKVDTSIRMQCGFALLAIIVSLVLHFTAEEFAIVLGFCALILGLEFTNSSIERIMNLEEPEISRSVKHIKDMSAAAVLVASFFALVVGIMFVCRHLF